MKRILIKIVGAVMVIFASVNVFFADAVATRLAEQHPLPSIAYLLILVVFAGVGAAMVMDDDDIR